MAHWAELDENSIIVRVVVGNNDDDREGLTWIEENLGGTWVQTSYNATFGGKFAGAGDTYDPETQTFIPLQRESDPNAIEIEGVK